VSPPSDAEVQDYLIQASKARGIDPKTTLNVWAHEGKGAWQSNYVKNGKREPSYGPLQLYTGGGLGNKFRQQTGLDPADPKNWKQGVDFALDYAKENGWGSWYGAKRAGITGKMGINGTPDPHPLPTGAIAKEAAFGSGRPLMNTGDEPYVQHEAQGGGLNIGSIFKSLGDHGSPPSMTGLGALPQAVGGLTDDQLAQISQLGGLSA